MQAHHLRPTGWLVCLGVLLAGFSVAAKTKASATEVVSLGQAVIYGEDTAAARDRAIDDAKRKAVEQAVGSMVSSETVTENFQLISDKIFSQARGYVRSYKVVSEGKQEGGIYQVKIKAQVGADALENDLQGILSVLRAKNMPRVLVMVAEQNVGQPDASFWWGNQGFATNMDVVENTFINAWLPKGIKFVDRQALQGKLKVGPAIASAAPSDTAIKEFASKTGAEVVVIGKAIATDNGPMLGTQMHSVRADISIRALKLDTGGIMGTATTSQAVGHINPTTGGNLALEKATQTAAKELLERLLSQWKNEVSGPATVQLTVQQVPRSRAVRQIMRFLRNEVRGVQDVRQRSYRKKVANLEVEIAASAQDLAMELEEKKFPGFAVEVEEITANAVTITLK